MLGFVFLAQGAVFNLIADEGTLPGAAVLFLVACAYLPAIWVCWRSSPSRQKVLRGVVAATMVFVVLGALLVSPAIAALLLVPSTLLAIAGRLIFQGARTRRE